MTYTKTYTRITFANPFLACEECGERVDAMRSDTKANLPCHHGAGVTSVCPSWGPVDGCTCSRAHIVGRDPHHASAFDEEDGRER